MKKSLLLALLIIFLIAIILYGCVNSRIVNSYPVKKRERSGRITGKKPYIRLLVAKGHSVYHLITKSSSIYVYNLNEKNQIQGKRVNIILRNEDTLDLLIKQNRIQIKNKTFLLPVEIDNLSPFNLNGISLEGDLIVYKNSIILKLPIEHYVEGVVASEVGSNWPIEALKAQAVVSRTYAVYKMLKNVHALYDIGTSELHQKYVLKKDISKIERAVELTRGIIIYYRNNPIQAFFHACSGGITESGGNVFLKDLPYLKSIRDPYSLDCPDKIWKINITSKDIISKLKGKIPEIEKMRGLSDVKIGARTSSGRVKFFILRFNNKNIKVKGNDFRLAMNPRLFKSLLITKIHKTSNIDGTYSYEFVGRGYGHGVGMSQWGARNMAMHGFSYSSIIRFYFRDVYLGSYKRLSIFKGK